ncbi:MAG TPA: TetR/AcrR family transcriptional regulator [Candidatus Krumholzibacterium sp.]|nr:TetR/AcrR family transcriptional regulator [Candidatus Krumholzibacterium sp.]
MAGIREEKKKRTRKTLVETAVRLFGERGFEGTSMEELAREAGVGKGTIYGYFATKHEIFLAFCEEEIDFAFRRLEEELDGDAPLIDQLVTLFMSQFDFVTSNPDFGRNLLREMIFPTERTSEKSRHIDSLYLSRIGAILARSQAKGELHPEADPLMTTGHFYALYLMTLSTWYGGLLLDRVEAEAVLRSFFVQALNGLGAATVVLPEDGHLATIRERYLRELP